MSAFAEKDIDWRYPDVSAILNNAGILSVLPEEGATLEAWLTARGYAIHTFDFGQEFLETKRQLGPLFRWEEEFGYRLESPAANLDGTNDGVAFQAAPGGRLALMVLRPDALLDQRDWLLRFLSIAADHSTYHLARGSRFLTVLSLPRDSALAGLVFDSRGVRPPWPLLLPDP